LAELIIAQQIFFFKLKLQKPYCSVWFSMAGNRTKYKSLFSASVAEYVGDK